MESSTLANSEFLLTELAKDLDSNNLELRKTALISLIRLGSGNKVEEIIRNFSEFDVNPEIRYIAKRALDKLNINNRPEFAQTRQLIARILQNTDEKKLEVYKRALSSEDSFLKLELLMQIYVDPNSKKDSKSIFAILKERLVAEKDPFLLPILIKGLGIYGDESTIAVLQKYLTSKNPRVVANAIEALEELNSDLTFSMVVGFLKHEDNRVRGNTVKLIFRFEPEKAIQELENMSNSSLLPMRDSAIFCLKTLDFPIREDILISMWKKESDDNLCLKIIKIMQQIGTQKGLVALYQRTPPLSIEEQCSPIIKELHRKLQVSPQQIQAKIQTKVQNSKPPMPAEVQNNDSITTNSSDKTPHHASNKIDLVAEEQLLNQRMEELNRAKEELLAQENLANQQKKNIEKQKKARTQEVTLKKQQKRLLLLAGGVFCGLFFLRLGYDTQVVRKTHTIDALTRQETVNEDERRLLTKAEFLKSRGNFLEAMQLLDKFLISHPADKKALQSKAFCLIMSGQIKEGYQKYQETAKIVRNSPSIQHNIAAIYYFYYNDPNQAAYHLKKALNFHNSYLPAQKLLAEIYEQQGQKQEATEIRQKVLHNIKMDISQLPPFRSLIEALQ